jgi:dipeptidyl aminopeptidase/acylaminoacyl peptidase
MLWASQGYFTVMINPEGSTGNLQGNQDFVDAVRNDWGGAPYESLKIGFEEFKKKYAKNVDPERACAAGASYGGYMVNWIQGKGEMNFKCLVTHDGVFSTVSMFYITDEIFFPYAEYCPLNQIGCHPWDEKYREGFTKFSPESLVSNWKIPHLIVHGSNDLRIPVSEGISAFTALQMKGVPSKFLHFSQENHWVLNQRNSIAWYENVLGWFDKYTKSS